MNAFQISKTKSKFCKLAKKISLLRVEHQFCELDELKSIFFFFCVILFQAHSYLYFSFLPYKVVIICIFFMVLSENLKKLIYVRLQNIKQNLFISCRISQSQVIKTQNCADKKHSEVCRLAGALIWL